MAKQFITEAKRMQKLAGIIIENTADSLKGKNINLIKTLHTTGNWNPEKKEMDKITKDEFITGKIGDINTYEDHYVPGFTLVDDNNKKIGFVMYDEKSNNFIAGDSIYNYTYRGQKPADQELLNQFKTK